MAGTGAGADAVAVAAGAVEVASAIAMVMGAEAAAVVVWAWAVWLWKKEVIMPMIRGRSAMRSKVTATPVIFPTIWTPKKRRHSGSFMRWPSRDTFWPMVSLVVPGPIASLGLLLSTTHLIFSRDFGIRARSSPCSGCGPLDVTRHIIFDWARNTHATGVDVNSDVSFSNEDAKRLASH